MVPAKLRREVPPLDRTARGYVKYGLLAGVVVYFLVTRDISIYRYVEPFWMFSCHGTTVMWIGLAVLLVATVFVRNLYCRFLCPVGAALGLLSNLTVFKIKRWSECNTCKICEKTCEWGAIRGPEDRQERMRPLRRLRAALPGPAEVPALVIIIRKQDKRRDFTARQSAAPSSDRRFLQPATKPAPRSSRSTITPSTSGSRSMSAMPASGPRMNTPFASASAMTARSGHERHAAAAARRLAHDQDPGCGGSGGRPS